MFIVKVSKEQQILGVKHYTMFQNALGAVADGAVFDCLSKEMKETLGNPKMLYCSESAECVPDDFEFRYENGVLVYLGRILFIDTAMKANSSCEKVTENEIEAVMNALAGNPTVTTARFADKIEKILKTHIA